jgi:ferric iron reductase protein FhuF
MSGAIPGAERVLEEVLARLPPDRHGPLVAGADESPVPATAIEDPGWLSEQIRLRGERWNTDDPRVLATLWWYSASNWTVGPTLTTLVADVPVLAADLEDLMLHWLPDSRITGATSSQVAVASPWPSGETGRIGLAAATLRRMYDRIIPAVAAPAGLPHRPLWAIATDAVANRLLAIGAALGDVEAAAGLLHPLVAAIGQPMPRGRYVSDDDGLRTRRGSCCLLYLAPGQSKCGSCPRRPWSGTVQD